MKLLAAILLLLAPAAGLFAASVYLANSGSGAPPGTLVQRTLLISHAEPGCHVWSDGATQGAAMRLSMPRGGELVIRDQDIDAHQLVQLGGPVWLPIGGPMTQGTEMRLPMPAFGTYRFTTRPV